MRRRLKYLLRLSQGTLRNRDKHGVTLRMRSIDVIRSVDLLDFKALGREQLLQTVGRISLYCEVFLSNVESPS
jgi:hypothetical protein